ncbi:MAG: DUF1775 domain-containing protein [Solirubrobacteraceae bacterium]
MTTGRRVRPRRWGTTAVAAVAALVGAAGLPSAASAHARVSPAVSLAGQLQLYTLAVPTEKQGAATAKLTLTVPSGFSIDSFAPSPGWRRSVQQSSSGQNAVVSRVTWSGGRTRTGEDSLFSFLAQPAQPGPIRFTVQQTYSDGSIVNWNGAQSSDAPAPTISAVATLSGGSGSGGGVSVATIVAIVIAVLALLASGFALSQRGGGGRPPA